MEILTRLRVKPRNPPPLGGGGFKAIHFAAKDHLRNLPLDYVQEIVDELDRLGHKVIVFGNDLNKNYDITNAMDLTNKLTVAEVFGLIRKAWLTITNDSAPVHIAAAFDNHLIVLPSIRHPDKLIHQRHGQRYWRVKPLYKKLMLDEFDWPVWKDLGFNWFPEITNKRDYLPDVSRIIDIINEFNERDIYGIY